MGNSYDAARERYIRTGDPRVLDDMTRNLEPEPLLIPLYERAPLPVPRMLASRSRPAAAPVTPTLGQAIVEILNTPIDELHRQAHRAFWRGLLGF